MQVNYNRKKDLEFIINSWSFFFRDYSFFTAPFFSEGSSMKVYGYTKDKQGIMEIENSLKAEQAFVGGLIECTALTEEIDLICNDEGWLIGLEPRVAIPESETIIAGDCFICRHDRRGNFQSIREEDIPLIESKVQYITEEMLLRLALLKYFGML